MKKKRIAYLLYCVVIVGMAALDRAHVVDCGKLLEIALIALLTVQLFTQLPIAPLGRYNTSRQMEQTSNDQQRHPLMRWSTFWLLVIPLVLVVLAVGQR